MKSTFLKVIGISSVAVLFSSNLFARPERIDRRSCVNVAGQYYADVYTFDVYQQGCQVAIPYVIGNFSHSLSANFRGNSGVGTITRMNMTNGCTTILSVRLIAPDANRLEIITKGTDGNCDLPVHWAQYAQLNR